MNELYMDELFTLEDANNMIMDLVHDGFPLSLLKSSDEEVVVRNRVALFRITESDKYLNRVHVEITPNVFSLDNNVIELEWESDTLIDMLLGR